MSNIQQDDVVSSLMQEIRIENPELHKDLLRQLGRINDNIMRLSPENKKAAVKNLFISISHRLTDTNGLRQRFLETFGMDTDFKEWNVKDERMDEDIEKVLRADASNPELGDRTSITANNQHERIISDDGSVNNGQRTFGRETGNAGKKTEKEGKKGGKRRKTNNKKRSKKKRTWRKYFGL
jgi:hypothetical protein